MKTKATMPLYSNPHHKPKEGDAEMTTAKQYETSTPKIGETPCASSTLAQTAEPTTPSCKTCGGSGTIVQSISRPTVCPDCYVLPEMTLTTSGGDAEMTPTHPDSPFHNPGDRSCASSNLAQTAEPTAEKGTWTEPGVKPFPDFEPAAKEMGEKSLAEILFDAENPFPNPRKWKECHPKIQAEYEKQAQAIANEAVRRKRLEVVNDAFKLRKERDEAREQLAKAVSVIDALDAACTRVWIKTEGTANHLIWEALRGVEKFREGK